LGGFEVERVYTPDRRFLDRVLALIQKNQFNVNHLQSLESSLFDGSIFSGKCTSSVQDTNLHLKKSLQLGFYVEKESMQTLHTETFASFSLQEVWAEAIQAPPLTELCFEALRESSYPQAFISNTEFLKDPHCVSQSVSFRPLSEKRRAVSLIPFSYLMAWALKIFNLNTIPPNFIIHNTEYSEFYSYVTAKGDYTPDRRFLDQVLALIQKNQFDVNHLQSLESSLFDGSIFSGKCTSSVQNSNLHLKKSLQLGFYAEEESVQTPLREMTENSKLPPLAELCFKALKKTSYPQAFISNTEKTITE
jgi:hypothetical protein